MEQSREAQAYAERLAADKSGLSSRIAELELLLQQHDRLAGDHSARGRDLAALQVSVMILLMCLEC